MRTTDQPQTPPPAATDIASTESKRARLARLLHASGKQAARAGTPPHARKVVDRLDRRFEAQAAATPDAVAVRSNQTSLTYGELDRAAARLACQLAAHHVRRGSRVAIFVERSPDMIVALLAVLKAGGTYVPLDPALPADRLQFILDDSSVAVVLSHRSLSGRLVGSTAPVIWLDESDLAPVGSAVDPISDDSADDVAYIIYTSGSTGTPKGVEVSHRNVARLLDSTQPRYRFGPTDVWTMFHSFGFDFSVWEIFGALLFGGRLIVVSHATSRSPEAFRQLLAAEGVTVLNQTPSAFRQLICVEETKADRLALRWVIFGGEALELQSLRPWFDRYGDVTPRLVNMYGITETTVHVTYREITRADLDLGQAVSPIGRAIPGWQVYLLDRVGQPVPIGVVGEIFVGGAGVARGYLNRPGLTADRFGPDDLGTVPGARLYRSGDLARRRPDGELEYVGRVDHQVKIRGFRIELGEIEAALLRQSELLEAVVLVREDRAGDPRLVAYVVARSQPGPTSSQLRRHLKLTLPDHMVPAVFVPLSRLPLTENGKVDRRGLPAPGGARPDLDGAFVPPRTAVEEQVARIWGAVLDLDEVGIHDNFFDLGGHSLLATQAISRIRASFGVDLPLRPLFETPTVAGLADSIEVALAAGERIAMPPLVRYEGVDLPPLAAAQRALWFLDQLNPGRATFHVTAAVRVAGPLDLDALGRSFALLTERHEALRTTFAVADGEPVQVVRPVDPGDQNLAVLDLRHLPKEHRRPEAERLASLEARRPFDLARDRLVRCQVVRLDDQDHVILLTMHHIITDGWSFGVAARELAVAYGAFKDRVEPMLPALPIRPTDFARWQQGWLSAGSAVESLREYWLNQLAGLEPLALPTDRPRPAVRQGRGALVPFSLPAGLSRAIVDLGRREGTTPFMTLLAAFQAMLHRLGGGEDIAVGSPIANRNRAEVEGLIGYFVNMLVLRGNLAGSPSFRELLVRTREVALGAFEHQDLPFDRLVHALQPERDLSRTPLFQAMFVLQNNTMPDVGRAELALEGFEVDAGTGTAKFDLTLALVETDGVFHGSIEYDVDLFERSTIDRMTARLQVLLEAVVLDPGRRLADIPLWLPGEVEEMSGWNPAPTPGSAPAPIHASWQEQAHQHPGAIAIIDPDRESWTYGHLDEQSNGLAQQLVALGVGPESLVGLCVDRSPSMAVAIWGILKAGGAFVPLDPTYPSDRLHFLVKDSGASLVLVERHLAERLPADLSAQVIVLDPATADETSNSPDVVVHPNHPAYVIYTSGSTGIPRGVVVPHRGVVNHADAAARLMGLSATDRVLQSASISFDIAIEEMFPAWSTGAAVVLRRDDADLDPSRFTELVARTGVTVLDLPTAHWHVWTSRLVQNATAIPDSLRVLIVGGERALPSTLAAWRSLPGAERVRWVNTYGPTETTVIATSFEPDAAWAGDLPIGRAIRNTRAYVLDSQLRPVPVGIPGELFIGGVAVARGYLDRPGLTAERFVPDPFAPAAERGARMFRTGDRVLWRLDGQIEFLGRVDEQVKIRGFRVEPGEVETALNHLPEIAEAVVVAQRGPTGEARLVAHVVPAPGFEFDAARLRQTLRAILPAPLVPASFFRLSELPLTPSGKVDRRALPTDPGDAGRSTPLVAPRTDREAQLVAIWEEVLGVRPVGVLDNFFDLGGHSLLAIRLLARVEETCGQSLPLASLFLGGTIADQAASLAEAVAVVPASTGDATRSPLVPIQPRGSLSPFVCVHPAGGIVYCFGDLARELGLDRPFWAFQARGLDGEGTPVDSLEVMASHYVAALRTAQPDGPYHLGGWSLGGLVAFEMARQLVAAGERVATLAIFDSEAPRGGDRADQATLDPVVGSELAAMAAEDGGNHFGADPAADAALLAEFADELAAHFGGDVRRMLGHFRRLTPTERRDLIFRHFQVDRVYTRETGPDRAEKLWAVLRATLLAGARYRPERGYPGPITLFRASRQARARRADRTMGWSSWVGGEVRVVDVPGDHASILKGAAAHRLAALLRPILREGDQ